MSKENIVLITGANRNTGFAIAERFAKAGAVVILNGRRTEAVAEAAGKLIEKYGARIVEAPADIAKPDEVAAMFAMIEKECGDLDVLVNNAIVQGVGYTFVDTPLDLLDDVFRINVFGLYHCSQLAARMMLRNKSGAIINIGSNTAERAIRNRTAYIASKGAIDALNRAMAIELAPHGIRVNSIVAGYIHSDRWTTLPEEDKKRRRANTPIGGEATGEDIADAVLFIASSNAAKINGARLVVDGGTSVQLVPPDCDL